MSGNGQWERQSREGKSDTLTFYPMLQAQQVIDHNTCFVLHQVLGLLDWQDRDKVSRGSGMADYKIQYQSYLTRRRRRDMIGYIIFVDGDRADQSK